LIIVFRKPCISYQDIIGGFVYSMGVLLKIRPRD
jgi:hypothetical protein